MIKLSQGAVAGRHRLLQVFDRRQADIVSLCDFFQGLDEGCPCNPFISALSLNSMWAVSYEQMPHYPEDSGALHSIADYCQVWLLYQSSTSFLASSLALP